MTSGKKRRRTDYRPPARADGDRGSTATDATPARPGGLFGTLFRGAAAGQSPYPPLHTSFLRGLIAVCSSPAILITIVALVFVIRFALVAFHLPARGSVFAATLALPPVGTVLDLQAAGAILGDATGFVIAPAFLAVRSVILAVLTGMVVESLRTGRVGRDGLLGGLRAFLPIFGIGIIELGAVFIGSLVIGFTGLGLVGVLIVLVAILFFFAYAPVVSVREPSGLLWTIRKSIRAARIPGSMNITLAFLYTVPALLMLPVFIPAGQDIDVNPGVATWVGILVANVFHVVALAVYCHRYLWAESDIPDPPEVRRAR
jgi:hypothetical protein